jgi:DNA-binding LytR/AlgR family response regulator
LLEERLREAQGRDRFVALRDGSRVHRVSEAEILFVRAADDYSEAHLADRRAILVTANLAALHASLPDRFLRVHKSYVVNADHVASLAKRPGGGRALAMSDGSEVPVGRAYREAVEKALK